MLKAAKICDFDAVPENASLEPNLGQKPQHAEICDFPADYGLLPYLRLTGPYRLLLYLLYRLL